MVTMALILILICKGPSGCGLEFAAELNGREFVEDLDTAVMTLLERYKIGLLAAKPVLPI
jgi:hypothetical protein